MVTCTKTTVDIADAVLAEARRLAEHRGTSLRSVIEAALRRELERARTEQPYEPEDCSYGEGGLTAEAEAAGGWSALRELAYDDGRDLRL